MDFTILIANKRILIHSVYSGISKICEDYLVEDDSMPDVEIYSDIDAIYSEYETALQRGEQVSSLNIMEGLVIHRRIAETLLYHDTFLMHGAVIAVGNTSYMFTGKSGIGKTTHIKLWLNNINSSFVVNGDKPLVIIDQKGAFACGTPWCGKEHFGANVVVPLHSIVFMERSSKNCIEEVSFKEALPRLLEQVYHPDDSDKMKKVLELLVRLRNHVSFYIFHFDNYQDDAFQTSFNAITK